MNHKNFLVDHRLATAVLDHIAQSDEKCFFGNCKQHVVNVKSVIYRYNKKCMDL